MVPMGEREKRMEEKDGPVKKENDGADGKREGTWPCLMKDNAYRHSHSAHMHLSELR